MHRSNRIARLIRAETVMLGLLAASLAPGMSARAQSTPGIPDATPSDDDDEPSSWTERIGDSVKGTFEGVGKRVGLGNKPEGPPPVEAPSGCPTIAIVDGTVSSRVMAAGASGNQGVRYQISLGEVGRQCSISGGRVGIKVAASGRVLLGPAGSAGRFDVPIRVVVFSEAQQKPVVSKLYKVPASLGARQASTPFQFVSDDIVVPTSGRASSEYSIKVGIDAGKGGGDAVATGKGRHRRQKQASQ